MRRPTGLIALLVLSGVVAFLVMRCSDDPRREPIDPGDANPIGLATDAPDAATIAGPDPAALAVADARNAAMRAAVSTLHRYLTALGTGDRSKSDPFWSGGKPPAASNEADLRTLDDISSLRIENGTPVPLDAAPVPDALEIPVTLRAGVKGSPQRRYQGHYRLRRKLDHTQWEVTSARIDALPARR